MAVLVQRHAPVLRYARTATAFVVACEILRMNLTRTTCVLLTDPKHHRHLSIYSHPKIIADLYCSMLREIAHVRIEELAKAALDAHRLPMIEIYRRDFGGTRASDVGLTG